MKTHINSSISRQSLSSQQSARGVSLVEALIALAMVSVCTLGLMQTRESLHRGSESSRHRAEALRLAQQAMEEQRAFATLGPGGDLRDYASLAGGRVRVDSESGLKTNTHYELTRRVETDPHFELKSSDIQVSWVDRQGQSQSLQLHSMVAGQDPALAVALSQAPRLSGVWGVRGRSSSVPLRAKDLGDGRSAFKPLALGGVVWIFDNQSGLVTASCTGAPVAVGHDVLDAEHVGECRATQGLLLSGVVRFSMATPPTPQAANDVPLSLSMDLRLSHAPSAVPPQCLSEAVKEVRLPSPAGPVFEWVPIAATPRSLGMVDWFETGERFVSYHCLVDVPGDGVVGEALSAWSGRSHVVPMGWRIGHGEGAYRVCRYSSDTDGSGAIDRNQEHPETYSKVQAALNQQHFLVIRGELTCPVGAPINVDGVGEQVYVDWSTVQHQP